MVRLQTLIRREEQRAASRLPVQPKNEGPFGRASFLEPWWAHLAPAYLKRGEAAFYGYRGWHVLAGFGAGDFAQVKPTPTLELLASRGLIMPRVADGTELAEWVQRREALAIPYDVSPRLDLSVGWETIAARRSSRTWSGLRRKARKLSAAGQVRYVHVTDELSLREWLPKVWDLYAARANSVRRAKLWASTAGQAFLSDWMAGLAREGALDLCFLVVADRPEAFVFGVRDPNCYYLYGLAFDPASPLVRYSPGEQLLIHVMKEAAATGVPTFDFLVGDEPYKRAWSDEARPVSTYILGPNTTSRRAIEAWFRTRQAIRGYLT